MRTADPIRQAVAMLPKGGCGRTWLYAIGCPDGTTKIGRTEYPRSRMRQHIKAIGPLNWMHLLSPVPRAGGYRAEYTALTSAAASATRVGATEFFVGLSKADAIAICRAAVNAKRTAEQAG